MISPVASRLMADFPSQASPAATTIANSQFVAEETDQAAANVIYAESSMNEVSHHVCVLEKATAERNLY